MAVYLPNSGSININGGDSRAINNIFGPANGVPAQGNNLLAYVGVRWYKADASTGVFTAPVTIPGDFYGKGPISPVAGGSYSLSAPTGGSSSAPFTVPLYSVMTVTLRGGAGGGGGGDGNYAAGGNGTPGNTSSFAGGSFGSPAFGGSGGSFNGAPSGPAPAGAGSDGNPSGGAGGPSAFTGFNAGQPGGAGGRSILTLYNPVPGNPPPYGPPVGSTVTVTAGGGGPGGASAQGISPWPWPPYFIINTPGGGAAGGNGSVFIQWS
jgi:hypothetical protein